MLPNHAPLVVAEQFALLEAAFPGRIDLGIGRAPGTDPLTRYVLRGGSAESADEAVELAKSFGGTDGHKYVNGVLDHLALQLRPDEVKAARPASR